MKHFKLRKDLSIEVDGIKLFQIEALVALPTFGVSVGELGGYIEKERNIDGRAWVSVHAMVYDNARVGGNAILSGTARAFGDARIYDSAEVRDSARVSGSAVVCGNACISGSSWVHGNSRICDNAQVYGNAWVAGDAHVSGNARVSDNARVYGVAYLAGDARVIGSAEVCGDVLINMEDCCSISGQEYNITITPQCLKIGHQFHTKEEWLSFNDETLSKADGYGISAFWAKWKPILIAIYNK